MHYQNIFNEVEYNHHYETTKSKSIILKIQDYVILSNLKDILINARPLFEVLCKLTFC